MMARADQYRFQRRIGDALAGMMCGVEARDAALLDDLDGRSAVRFVPTDEAAARQQVTSDDSKNPHGSLRDTGRRRIRVPPCNPKTSQAAAGVLQAKEWQVVRRCSDPAHQVSGRGRRGQAAGESVGRRRWGRS